MSDQYNEEFLRQLDELRAELSGDSQYLELVFDAATGSIEKLKKYNEVLELWNKSTDLIAPASQRDIIQAHFIDSIAGLAVSLSYLNKIPKGVFDVGSGAGFPGLVWGILFPQLKVRLVEPRKKRIDFLTRVVSTLGLENVEVVASRIEEVPEDLDANFDFSVCRALGMEDDYLAEAQRLLSAGALCSAMVGPSWDAAAKHVDEPIERIDYKLAAEGPNRSLVFW